MKLMRMLILTGMTVWVLALAGCGDRTKDPGAERSEQTAEDLRHRAMRTQSDR